MGFVCCTETQGVWTSARKGRRQEALREADRTDVEQRGINSWIGIGMAALCCVVPHRGAAT